MKNNLDKRTELTDDGRLAEVIQILLEEGIEQTRIDDYSSVIEALCNLRDKKINEAAIKGLKKEAKHQRKGWIFRRQNGNSRAASYV